MNTNIPIFCINLERATERKNLIIKEWIDALGFDIKFWKAYDRRDIEQGNYRYPYDEEKTKNILGRSLSFGEMACATSFCMLYEYILEQQYKEVIIMEDDVSPIITNKDTLYESIDVGLSEFPQTEYMILHKSDLSYSNIISKQKYFSKVKPLPWGNLLLYQNYNATYKLYKLLSNFTGPADHPQRILDYNNKLNAIVINEGLCKHNTNTTYIGNDLRFSREIRDFIV